MKSACISSSSRTDLDVDQGRWADESGTTVPVLEERGDNATAIALRTPFEVLFSRRLERIIGIAASDGGHITSSTREMARLGVMVLLGEDPQLVVPNVGLAQDDEVVLEWWCGPRKLSIYIGEQGAQFVQVWGANIHTEMADGDISNSRELLGLYQWLRGN